MTTVTYTEYLHDEWEEIDYLFKHQTGIELTSEQREKLGRPFYEIALQTKIDLETGQVWVTHINGTILSREVPL